MGGTIGIEYENKIMRLPQKSLTFDLLKENIKSYFPSLANQSITIRSEKDSQCIATEYK